QQHSQKVAKDKARLQPPAAVDQKAERIDAPKKGDAPPAEAAVAQGATPPSVAPAPKDAPTQEAPKATQSDTKDQQIEPASKEGEKGAEETPAAPERFTTASAPFTTGEINDEEMREDIAEELAEHERWAALSSGNRAVIAKQLLVETLTKDSLEGNKGALEQV